MRKKILSRKFLSIITVIILATVIAVPVLASPATATRNLPASVVSEVEFDVTVIPSGCGVFGQVMETLPDGFIYISCTPSDIGVEQIGNTVKFSFLESASFTYRVKAPTVATTTTYIFNGEVLDDNRISYLIEDDEIAVVRFDPWVYDEDDSGFIEIGELLQTITDYIGGNVTISQLLEVIRLYISHTPKSEEVKVDITCEAA